MAGVRVIDRYMESDNSATNTERVSNPRLKDIPFGFDFSNDRIAAAAMNDEAIEASVINGANDLRKPTMNGALVPRRTTTLSIRMGKSTERQTKIDPMTMNSALRTLIFLKLYEPPTNDSAR